MSQKILVALEPNELWLLFGLKFDQFLQQHLAQDLPRLTQGVGTVILAGQVRLDIMDDGPRVTVSFHLDIPGKSQPFDLLDQIEWAIAREFMCAEARMGRDLFDRTSINLHWGLNSFGSSLRLFKQFPGPTGGNFLLWRDPEDRVLHESSQKEHDV
jgi:hypothetical protein